MTERRTTLVSEKLVRQKKRRRNIFLSIFFGSLAIFLAILFFVFRAPFLHIKEVNVEGNEIIDAESIKVLVEGVLSQNYVYIIPKKNRLVYPKNVIEQKIRKEIGRVENIDLNVDGHTLKIKIGERGSYALWCREESDCYFIDKFGLIFSKSPVFSRGIYKIFSGVITDEDPLHKQFLEPEMISEIDKITDFLESQGWQTTNVVVTTVRDVLLIQEGGPRIKIDITKPSEETLKILKTLLDSNEFKKMASNIKQIDYIDMRFGSKVFFKPKNSLMSASTVVPGL